MKTEESTTPELRALRAFARYQTHGGYVWAAVMDDGGLMCERCVLGNYREVFRATRDSARTGWAVQGLTNSGEADDVEYCAHCGKQLWERN
jgi:hypothetical protein